MVIWKLSVCFWRNFSLVKSGQFWSSVLVKIPNKVYPKLFFLIRHGNYSIQYSIFGLQHLKKSQKYFFFCVFWPFFRSLRPWRGHPHSKFWKVVEKKWFKMSVHNFSDYNSSWFLHFSNSLHPNVIHLDSNPQYVSVNMLSKLLVEETFFAYTISARTSFCLIHMGKYLSI
jgi:hypothetical protein